MYNLQSKLLPTLDQQQPPNHSEALNIGPKTSAKAAIPHETGAHSKGRPVSSRP